MTLLASDSPESATSRPLGYGLRRWSNRMLGVMALVLVALLATLLVQINTLTSDPAMSQRTMLFVLSGLAVLLVLMAFVVIRRASLLWLQAKEGLIGTRLQTRIIFMFCVVAIVPTVTVSVFSALFFNYGLQAWFDARVSSALEDSVTVAAAYIEEHKAAIRSDAVAMGDDIQRELPQLFSNPQQFSTALTEETNVRNLSEAVVFDRSRVLTRTALSFSLMFERLPEEILDRADAGDVVVFGEDQDRIQAVVKLSRVPQLYLMVGRMVDAQMLKHMEAARTTVTQYERLRHDIRIIQQQFFAVFMLVALLLLLASLWAGMMLAVRLIGPITRLMAATERVRAGDYSTKVPEGKSDDEIANLGRTFNRMVSQLEAQRRDLLEANRLLDERRRFTETVLSGVSAGIIAVDANHTITLHNGVALALLGLPEDADIAGKPIAELMPEAESLLKRAATRPERVAEDNATLLMGERRVTLHLQAAAERDGETIEGYIVTFDDITPLVAAQRNAAWADVARRIAHEIKNPLTPITLSTERLRKKFAGEVSDVESYERYLDTITRHVRDIGRMVEEFVAFARMPAPVFREEDIAGLLRKSAFSEQTVHTDITYTLELPKAPVLVTCDESQLGQALLNLLKNAAEALEAGGKDKKEIAIALKQDEAHVIITLTDNGPGFPESLITRLTEPYVTTRTRGSGLGLAIAKKTLEEHKGSLTLSNRDEGGALVTLTLPKNH
ncbi:MAG: ATP-binding protein [Alphaproteobacteria bacterium]